jgi:5-enolpyruvylshikimate-3-phosphate synthase
MAMALAVAGLIAEEETIVDRAECINTSFPEFVDILFGAIKE